MLRFIINRLLITIPTILVVITITGGLSDLPGQLLHGRKKAASGIEQNIREKYGLDKPWYEKVPR